MTTQRQSMLEIAARLMTRLLLAGVTCCTLAVAQTSQGCQTGSSEHVTAWLTHIAAELRQLHLEVLRDRQENLQAQMKDLRQESEAVQGRQDQEKRTHVQELAEVEAQLSQPNLDKAEREGLENRRADLLANSGGPRSPESALAQRQVQTLERLSVVEQRFQLLSQRIQDLTTGR